MVQFDSTDIWGYQLSVQLKSADEGTVVAEFSRPSLKVRAGLVGVPANLEPCSVTVGGMPYATIRGNEVLWNQKLERVGQPGGVNHVDETTCVCCGPMTVKVNSQPSGQRTTMVGDNDSCCCVPNTMQRLTGNLSGDRNQKFDQLLLYTFQVAG